MPLVVELALGELDTVPLDTADATWLWVRFTEGKLDALAVMV